MENIGYRNEGQSFLKKMKGLMFKMSPIDMAYPFKDDIYSVKGFLEK